MGIVMYNSNNMGNSLKASYTHFLESHGFTHFFGVDSASRGSKIISVFIKKEHKQEFEKLDGGSDDYRRYYVMPVYETDDSIKYIVSCRKI
jgi:hypothetical protein